MFRSFLLSLSLVSCSCVTTHLETSEAAQIERLMASTVQIRVNIGASLFTPRGQVPLPVESWSGSGVIYGEKNGKSLVLTANHVLEIESPDAKALGDLGEVKVTQVEIQVTNYMGKVCHLDPLVMGDSEHDDVAVALADCNLGPAAAISTYAAPLGAKVFAVGHPRSVPFTVVTDGYIGTHEETGFQTSSNSISGGSSGGPLFMGSQVVGIVVRGLGNFPNVCLSIPLPQIWAKIAQVK